jgi:hypothetical protein
MANGNSNASTTTIIVALIGLVGVLGAAWIARMGPPSVPASGPANAAQAGSVQANPNQANSAQANAGPVNNAQANAAQAGPAQSAAANTATKPDAAAKAVSASDNSANAARRDGPTATSPFVGTWVGTNSKTGRSVTFTIVRHGGRLVLQLLDALGTPMGNPTELGVERAGVITQQAFTVFDDNIHGHGVATAGEADMIATRTWTVSGDELIDTNRFDYRRAVAGNPAGVVTKQTAFRRRG